MKNLNIDLISVLLLALSAKAVFDGGSFPIAIAIAALVAGQSFKAYLNKKDSKQAELDQGEMKLFKERISSLESKLALTFGSNRMK